MKKTYTIPSIMVGVAVLAVVLGLLVMRQRIQNPEPSYQTDNNQQATDNTKNTDQVPEENTQVEQSANLTGWQTYDNTKHTFSLKHPANLKAGAVSSNSVLGTFQVPVKGFHVGPLVLIVLKDAQLKTQAQEYFEASYQIALNPPQVAESEPVISCKVDKITNTIAQVRSVSCIGEGGPARYAYIKGSSYDVFVDGYSQGYDDPNFGAFVNSSDYVNILSTFKFASSTTVSTTPAPTPTQTPTPSQTPTPPGPNPVTTPTPTPSPNTQPTIQQFVIAADELSANPNQITVTKDNIVQITFNVSNDNVYYGGIDFRSLVVNSGTIYAGQSKTISFKATQSFDFIPYWPASSVAKNYKIKVVAE